MNETAKQLRRDYNRNYREANKERISQKQKEWREANKDKLKAYTSNYWNKKAKELQEAQNINE